MRNSCNVFARVVFSGHGIIFPALSGVVALQPQDGHLLDSVSVRLWGTPLLVNADSTGEFTVPHLPAGTYTIECSLPSTMNDYLPVNITITHHADREQVLTDTLYLPYTGIPVVQGLRAGYDTLAGIVRLQWNGFPDSCEGIIVRRLFGTGDTLCDTIAMVDSDRYDDSLFVPGASNKSRFVADTVSRLVEYTIVLRDASGRTGNAATPVRIMVVSPYVYRVDLSPVCRSIATGEPCTSVAAGDTFMILTSFNGTRTPLAVLCYYNRATDSLLMRTSFSTPRLAGNDTVRLFFAEPDDYTVVIIPVDTSGMPPPFSADTLHLSVTNRLVGDVTFDGVVDAEDSARVVQHLEGIRLLDALERRYADVNEDAVISIHDARLVGCREHPVFPVSGTVGDVNLDGKIDDTDVGLVTAHFKDSIYLDCTGRILGDVNADDSTDYDDAMLIGKYYLGLIDEFPFDKK